MKTLQNNYTTPEQSKRLLALGVPADSADCYYYDWAWYEGGDLYGRAIQNCLDFGKENQNSIRKFQIFPCWSVGRLIEIFHICDKPGCSFSFHVSFPNLISEIIYKIAEAKERGWIDFSKLED